MVSFVDKSFFVSLSKALGCKRVHDDRIAGVTFEENTLRNALIVNKEYAWVGNPFSAPRQKGEGFQRTLPFVFVGGRQGILNREPQPPLPGAGVSIKDLGNTRAQRGFESRFPLQSRRGKGPYPPP